MVNKNKTTHWHEQNTATHAIVFPYKMRFVNIQLHAQVDLQNSAEARFKNNEWCTKVVHWHALYTQHIHARTGWKKAHTFLLVVLIGIGQSWRSTGTNKYSKRTQKIKASCCFFVFFLRHEIFRVAYKKIHTHTKKVVSNSNRLGICCCYFCLFNSKPVSYTHLMLPTMAVV